MKPPMMPQRLSGSTASLEFPPSRNLVAFDFLVAYADSSRTVISTGTKLLRSTPIENTCVPKQASDVAACQSTFLLQTWYLFDVEK